MLKLLERLNMHKVKLVSTPLVGHYFKLSLKQSPTSEKQEEEMKTIPYASAVCSFMCDMVCTDLISLMELELRVAS